MKRNLFPLLGIAVLVAIAATGVFYGLFVGKISGAAPAAAANPAGVVVVARAMDRGLVLTAADVRLVPAGAERPDGAFGSVDEVVGRTVVRPLAANEPVIASGLAGPRGVSELTIPKGMRAISIRVADSSGLMPYLRPGNRIDVQSIHPANTGEAPVRTLLSNVEVLNVLTDTSPQPAPGTVLNLLVPARDVERVALADSAAKVRIVLRNRDDKEELPAAPVANVQQKWAAAPAAAAGPRVSFQVRMAAAPADTLRDIAARAGMSAGVSRSVRIGVLPADWKVESLEQAKSIRMLSNENVDSPQWQEVSLQAGGTQQSEYDLRLRLTPRGSGNGLLRVRVRPELNVSERGGVSSRRFSADLNVAEGQSLLVAGFEGDASAPALIEKLFHSPTQHLSGSELLMVVTSRFAAAR
jgi:Flp pilus assembly protein CpaB